MYNSFVTNVQPAESDNCSNCGLGPTKHNSNYISELLHPHSLWKYKVWQKSIMHIADDYFDIWCPRCSCKSSCSTGSRYECIVLQVFLAVPLGISTQDWLKLPSSYVIMLPTCHTVLRMLCGIKGWKYYDIPLYYQLQYVWLLISFPNQSRYCLGNDLQMDRMFWSSTVCGGTVSTPGCADVHHWQWAVHSIGTTVKCAWPSRVWFQDMPCQDENIV